MIPREAAYLDCATRPAFTFAQLNRHAFGLHHPLLLDLVLVVVVLVVVVLGGFHCAPAGHGGGSTAGPASGSTSRPP